MSFDKFVEERIREAMERGEFDNLPGKGEPIDLDAYFATPADLRVGYSVLKSNKFVPEEVELLREVARLKAEVAECADPERKKTLAKALREATLKLDIQMEHFRRSRRRA